MIQETCFPSQRRFIQQLRPRAFVIENVKGLIRPSFSDYFDYIRLRLQHPELTSREAESWRDYYARLQKEHTSVSADLQYRLITTIVDAADYGVPQRRHRVIMVGFRSDVDARWSFPKPTHSRVALRRIQDSGAYWDNYCIRQSDRHPIALPSKELNNQDDALQPWMTVRDAPADLPEPVVEGSRTWLNHTLQSGAKSYLGHTGSLLDEPSKALKAGVHGVPGEENMMFYPDGHVRYYSVREAARIQTFPDCYELNGSWSEVMRQLGNTVPVKLAETVVSSVVEHLEQDTELHHMAAIN